MSSLPTKPHDSTSSKNSRAHSEAPPRVDGVSRTIHWPQLRGALLTNHFEMIGTGGARERAGPRTWMTHRQRNNIEAEYRRTPRQASQHTSAQARAPHRTRVGPYHTGSSPEEEPTSPPPGKHQGQLADVTENIQHYPGNMFTGQHWMCHTVTNACLQSSIIYFEPTLLVSTPTHSMSLSELRFSL